MLINNKLRVTGGMELRNPLEDMYENAYPRKPHTSKGVRLAGETRKRESHRDRAAGHKPSGASGKGVFYKPLLDLKPATRCERLETRSGSEFELLDFERTERFQTTDEVFEIIGVRMCGQSLGRSPRFAEHEHIGARSALENIVRNTAGVRTTGSHQREGIFQRYGILLIVGLKETIDANHEKGRN